MNNAELTSREAAFLALSAWHKKGLFLWDSLQKWKERAPPATKDLNFAYELACGSLRALGYLEWVARRASSRLPKKADERLLLYLALYQKLFLKNIPLFAVVNESVELAKKYTSKQFASFLNAILRKEIPDAPESTVVRLCYPKYYVTALTDAYGEEKAYELLVRGNSQTPLMATKFTKEGPVNGPCEAFSDDCYIQNSTPFTLVIQLAKEHAKALSPPKRILDMCASPGGKTLLLCHLFPDATVVASDLSKKLPLLQENLARFKTNVHVQSEESEHSGSYDLIVVDAPCSNSGVLFKCPEARWRLSKNATLELQKTQISLLEKAKNLLTPGGTIWYMTCSILPDENEQIVQEAIKRFSLKETQSILQLPNSKGFEGGFASSLTS